MLGQLQIFYNLLQKTKIAGWEKKNGQHTSYAARLKLG